MRNKNEQTGNITLVVVLTLALIIGLAGLGKKLADAKVRDIQKTIEQQFQEKGE